MAARAIEILLPMHVLADVMDGIRVIGWSLAVVVFILVGFVVVARLRHWLKEDDTPVGIGFTLSDLRQLHREGKMSDEEFEKAREKMIAAGKAMAAKLPDPLARDRKPRNLQEPPADPDVEA